MKNNSLINLVVVLISSIAMLVLFEIIFRFTYEAKLPQPRMVHYKDQQYPWCCGPQGHDEHGLWSFIPNESYRHCYDGGDKRQFEEDGCITFDINNLGFRDHDRSIEKPENVYRIIVIGDSFTVGEATKFDDIFTSVLSKKFETKTIEGKKIEVINLGIPGEHTYGEYQRYLIIGRKLNPDFVIVQWNTNDFPSESAYEQHQKVIGYKYSEMFKDSSRYEFSHLLHFVWYRWKRHSISKSLISISSNELRNGVTQFQYIKKLMQTASTDQAQFLVIIFPELIRFKNYPYQNMIDSLSEYARKEDIDLLNLIPDLAKYPDRKLWAHEVDHHPNALAHRIAADAIYEKLIHLTD